MARSSQLVPGLQGHRIFVYGTLMRSEAGHPYLAHCRFEGETRTLARYDLVDVGGYPGLVSGGNKAIRGEIYAIDERSLPLIDEYEDVPELYVRRAIELECGTRAEAYLLQPRIAQRCPSIPSADWRRR